MTQTINVLRIPVTTTGSAGSASGNATSTPIVSGYIERIYLDFHASAPATTDTTISVVGHENRTILTLTNVNTDGDYPVRIAETGNTGTAAATTTRLAVVGQIKVALAQCDALTGAVVAYVYLLR